MLKTPSLIHGDKIVLRPHKASDLAAFETFLTDPEATRFMGFTAEQRTAAGAAAMMNAVIASYPTDAPVFSLTIADPETDAYLGAAGAADSGNDTVENIRHPATGGTRQIQRPAADGALGHRDMTGLRYRLTRTAFDGQVARS